MSFCIHCDENILYPVFNDLDKAEENPFCCLGCLTVFNIINHKGLGDYYEIKKQAALFKRRSPIEIKHQKYTYLDSVEFGWDYSYLNQKKLPTMEFYLEGIHCLACLWLVEKLPEYLNDASECRLDMTKSVATVSLNENGSFSNVAKELNNLGYKPHPLKINQDSHLLKIKEERQMLLKIGVAGAGAGNVMLYAVSIYAGASGKWAETFNLLSVAFAFPVLFYSASPFYKNAWNALKNHSLSIDIPISLALIVGSISGVYNLTNGINDNYFDSLTALVFLLLLSRYFLNKMQEKGLTANDLNFFYEGHSILKKVNQEFIETHPQFLQVGDVIKIPVNEMIPADGIILEGETNINNSLLTGESFPEKAKVNSHVFSGTINISQEILLEVCEVKENSRIGKILKQVESGWILKSPFIDLTNKISQYFVGTVFLLAALLFGTLYLQGKTKTAIERAFTLLIVTCPCALALATPLTLTRTLSRASRKGIIIKNNEVLEKLSSIKSVFLDKTGTITYGLLKVKHFKILLKSHFSVFEIINSLENYSQHPTAKALREYSLQKGINTIQPVQNYIELTGKGVSGEIGNHFYEIKENKIFEDNLCVAEFLLADHIRPDSNETIKKLKSLGLTVNMISGDQNSISKTIALEADINNQHVFSEMTPEKKLLIIEDNPHALMVGDGANDAMALSRSYVSVAVLGSLDISLRAADIFLTTPGISLLPDLITISNETMKVVKRNLILSLVYNSLSVYAAFTGLISPLVAAIIMPLSSLTVLVSTLSGTKKLNATFKKDLQRWKL